jgi:hypothetical protein
MRPGLGTLGYDTVEHACTPGFLRALSAGELTPYSLAMALLALLASMARRSCTANHTALAPRALLAPITRDAGVPSCNTRLTVAGWLGQLALWPTQKKRWLIRFRCRQMADLQDWPPPLANED